MNYAMVENGVVVNIIVADSEVAARLGALPAYDGCTIGEAYHAPPDALTLTQLAVAELGQTVEDNNTASQLAIAELAEALLGGDANGEAVL